MSDTCYNADERRQAYLDALRNCGLKGVSAKQASVSMAAVEKWRREPLFQSAEFEAMADAAETLELEARRRAHDGVERQKAIGSGDNVQFITETHYSDTLMMFLLKGNNPDKFKDRTASEISGPGGQPVQIDGVQSAARIAAILEAARLRAADPFE